MALTRILVPVAWKSASNEAVKFDPRSRIRNLVFSGQRGEPGSVRRLVQHPAGLPTQHGILMPKHQYLGRYRPVAAEQHYH